MAFRRTSNLDAGQPASGSGQTVGRLAIDWRYHNQGIGSALLRDALLRAVHVAGDAGVFAILVHALSEPARRFYLSRGFVESPLQPMTLLMTLATVRATLAELT